MSGFTVTAVPPTLECPHGGKVAIVSASPVANAGLPIATIGDVYTVSGCTTGCVTVVWSVSDKKVKVKGKATLSLTSVGLCKSGSGADLGVVIMKPTQQKVSTR
jgi:hypothetical protein